MAGVRGTMFFEVQEDDGTWSDISDIARSFDVTHGSRSGASPERPIPIAGTGSLVTQYEDWQADDRLLVGQQPFRIRTEWNEDNAAVLWTGLRESPRVVDEREQLTRWDLVGREKDRMAERLSLAQTVPNRPMREFLADAAAWQDRIVPMLLGVDDTVLLGLFEEEDIANRTVGRLALMLGGMHGHRSGGELTIAGLNPDKPQVSALPFDLYALRGEVAVSHIRNEIAFDYTALGDTIDFTLDGEPVEYDGDSAVPATLTETWDVEHDDERTVSEASSVLDVEYEYSAGITTRTQSYTERYIVRYETSSTTTQGVVSATASGSNANFATTTATLRARSRVPAGAFNVRRTVLIGPSAAGGVLVVVRFSYSLTVTSRRPVYSTRTRTRKITSGERRTRAVASITGTVAESDTDDGTRLSAEYTLPDLTEREVFTDADGFTVPPASGDIWADDVDNSDKGQLLKVTVTPRLTYTTGRPLEENLTLTAAGSVERWGLRPMVMPPWFGGEAATVTERVQAQLDRAAIARNRYTVRFPVWQASPEFGAAAAAIDALSYIQITAFYPIENVDVDVVALVLQRRLSWSARSNLVCELVCIETATAPVSLPAGVPRGLSAMVIDSQTIALSWQRGTGRQPSTYTIRYRAGTDDWTEVEVPGTQTTRTVADLAFSTAYDFQIKADDSEWSSTVTATTPDPSAPMPPTGLTVTLSGTSALLSWTAPTTGGVVVGYATRHRIKGTSSWTVGSGVTDTMQTVTGLKAGTTYQFQARSNGLVSNSAWTASEEATTELGAVTGLAAVVRLSTSLAMEWDAVTDATGYDVQFRSPPADFGASRQTAQTSINLSGLTEDTNYEVRVRARTSFTTGPWAVLATATTSDLAPPVPRVSPSPVDEKTVLRVVFDAVDGGLSYNMRYRETGTAQWTLAAVEILPLPRFNDISGLDEGTSYDVQLLVNGAGGPSEWSATVTGTTAGGVAPTKEAFILTEDGFIVLTEDGSKLALEDSVPAGFTLLDEEGDAVLLEDGSRMLLERA